MIETYAFVWGAFVGTLFLYLLHLTIFKTKWLVKYGIHLFIFTAILCIARLLFPLQFSFFEYKVEVSSFLFTPLKRGVSFHGIPLSDIILYCYTCITLLIFAHFQNKIRKIKKSFWEHSIPADHANDILHEIDEDCNIPVRSNLLIKTPLISGYFHPIIYLPEYEISDKELRHIILHEYTHWKHHHPIFKYFIHLFTIIFWWNPVVRLIEKDLSHLFELVCDDIIFQTYNPEESLSYLETILHCLTEASITRREIYYNFYFIGMVRPNQYDITKERFRYHLTKDDISMDKKYTACIYLTVLSLFVVSYYISVQPLFHYQGDTNISSSKNTKVIKTRDGSYEIHYKGHVIEVDQQDLKDGYYDVYPLVEE